MQQLWLLQYNALAAYKYTRHTRATARKHDVIHKFGKISEEERAEATGNMLKKFAVRSCGF